HLLDSLVVFADVGDQITVTPAETLHLTVTGPWAGSVPRGDDNLVLRAARAVGNGRGAAITLNKMLPVASGIGGGSADAAATLRALIQLWDLHLPNADTVQALGADVPVCLAGQATRMTGIGGELDCLTEALPKAWLVLANPGMATPTADVFRALALHDNAPMPPDLPRLRELADLTGFLRHMRNDLEIPAINLVPAISRVKAALATLPGCLLTRMSGSGATCFGLFADVQTAATAASTLRAAEPGWWVAAAAIRENP
ncbi:MAG: 4-(cytidine 5'-diphospho)-2-C-methyl-D-erythritol kinase, partial [Paracoccaceae bacterium]|nr:4-(cytidine 5'-diphospho)-2-C-methyl-D-erythritol kinase [Paracoccaceae bacterium]